nr:hypothetical protein BaRGS_017912 [Batillaria attramentaria]
MAESDSSDDMDTADPPDTGSSDVMSTTNSVTPSTSEREFGDNLIQVVQDQKGGVTMKGQMNIGAKVKNVYKRPINIINNYYVKEFPQQNPSITHSMNGHADVIKKLIEKGADINRKDKNGSTEFQTACAIDGGTLYIWLARKGKYSMKGHVDVVKKLIEKGAGVNRKDVKWDETLHTVCSESHVDIVRYLLESGAVVDSQNARGMNGHVDVVKKLIEKGADIDRKDKNGSTEFQTACAIGGGLLYIWLVRKGN